MKQVLKNLDMAGPLVKWAMELVEYDITYEPRGLVKAQVLVNFVAELTLPKLIRQVD